MIERAHLLNQKKEATITLIFSYDHILPGIKRAINWDIIVSSPRWDQGGMIFVSSVRQVDQDPGDPGVGKVRGEKDFFSFKQGG